MGKVSGLFSETKSLTFLFCNELERDIFKYASRIYFIFKQVSTCVNFRYGRLGVGMKKSLHRLLFSVLFLLTLYPSISAMGIIVPGASGKTIGEAMIRAKEGDTLYLSNGTFRELVFLKSGVTLVAKHKHKAIIDGGGRGTVVTMGKNCHLAGLVIKNGTIGVFSNNKGNSIKDCHIIRHWQTGLMVVRHLPEVEDNLIAFNQASGIQGWDVHSTVSSINHNTIAYNANHGIAIGGKSNIVIENNVIAYNERYGLKISDESKDSHINKNNFYKNLRSTKSLPKGNYSFNPAFLSPRVKLNFESDPQLCCKVRGTDNKNLGIRF